VDFVTPMSSSAPTSDAGASWTHRALLAPGVRRLALLGLLASLVFPVSGLGVDLCPLHRATGLPCPGCGLSRAVAAASQGDFVAALGLNPFVLVAWPLLLALALLALAPSAVVARVERRLDAYGPGLTRAFHLGLAALLGFGVLRVVVLLAFRESFP